MALGSHSTLEPASAVCGVPPFAGAGAGGVFEAARVERRHRCGRARCRGCAALWSRFAAVWSCCPRRRGATCLLHGHGLRQRPGILGGATPGLGRAANRRALWLDGAVSSPRGILDWRRARALADAEGDGAGAEGVTVPPTWASKFLCTIPVAFAITAEARGRGHLANGVPVIRGSGNREINHLSRAIRASCARS